VNASEEENIDLFHATCGGMGLTGVILSASIQMTPILSSLINQKTIKADCIEAAYEAFERNCSATYSVAWIDCLAKGKSLGRSVLMLGEHAEIGNLDIDIQDPVFVPFNTPSRLLNCVTIKTFNSTYWHKARHSQTNTVPLMPYFYPLDVIGSWNKLYGKSGFLQYQCVIPKVNVIANLRKLLTVIAESGESPFLAVLKQLGKANNNLLSFPIEGYTLALDFKLTTSALRTLHSLEELVVGMGGRVYLTKDAVMQEASFKATYPKWETFETVREKYGAIGKFSSAQSKRLGLS
jgi:FAD/FMN-containing dehydrogenase